MVFGEDHCMNFKIVGAILIILTCGTVGARMGAAYMRQYRQLEDLLRTFHYMKCELQYRLTPLPNQFKQCSRLSKNAVSRFYRSLHEELRAQILPDAQCCVKAAIEKNGDLCKKTVDVLYHLGSTLGCFELTGQIAGIDAAAEHCNEELQQIKEDRPNRIRNYQTLSLCAGAALIIVLI